MKTGTLLIVTALGLAAIPSLQAQTENAYQSFSSSRASTRQDAKEVEDIGVVSESGDADGKGYAAKETAEPEPRTKFRFGVSARGQYTSNAKLSGNHGSSDFLFYPTLDAGFRSELGAGFGFDLGAKVETVLYARNDDRAFMGYSAQATLDWRPRPNLPRLYIGAEPYRYDSFDTGDLVTQAVGLSAGTDWGFGFNEGNSLFFIGYQFTDYVSDPSIDNRTTNRGIIGVTHVLRPQLIGQVYYNYLHNNFLDVDRRDSRHIVGLSLTWQINRNLFGILSGSFVDSDSTQDRASYQSAGAAAEIRLAF